MSLTVGTFASTFTHLTDFLDLFDGATDADDIQAILHRLADESPQQFIDTLNHLRQSVSQLAASEMTTHIVNYDSPPAPGELYMQGQEAAADIARNLDLDDVADEIEATEPPPTFPFAQDTVPGPASLEGEMVGNLSGATTGVGQSRLLDYADGFLRAAATVRAKAVSIPAVPVVGGSGVGTPEEAKKLLLFADRLQAIAAHQKTFASRRTT